MGFSVFYVKLEVATRELPTPDLRRVMYAMNSTWAYYTMDTMYTLFTAVRVRGNSVNLPRVHRAQLRTSVHRAAGPPVRTEAQAHRPTT